MATSKTATRTTMTGSVGGLISSHSDNDRNNRNRLIVEPSATLSFFSSSSSDASLSPSISPTPPSSPALSSSSSGAAMSISDDDNDDDADNRNASNRIPPSQSTSSQQFSVAKFFKMMKYERLRLITYLLYGHKWPKMNAISPSELAKAGFFYLHDDSVQCAFCRGVIRDWNLGDIAMDEHRRLFPNCRFVLRECCGNIPLEMDPIVNCDNNSLDNNSSICNLTTNAPIAASRQLAEASPSPPPLIIGNYNKTDSPKYPLFCDHANRTRSFRSSNWSKSAAPGIDIDALIDAGFFYIGKDDCTRCFHCGGMLYKWAADERPLEEHARFFPECHWLISTRGETFIEFVSFKCEIIELRRRQRSDDDDGDRVMNADIACMRAITYDNFLRMKQAAHRTMNRLVNRNSSSLDDNCKARARRRQPKSSSAAGVGRNNNRPVTATSSSPLPASSAGESDDHHLRQRGDDTSTTQRYLSKRYFLTDCQHMHQYLQLLEIMKQSSSSSSSPSPPPPPPQQQQQPSSSSSLSVNNRPRTSQESPVSSSSSTSSTSSLNRTSIFSLDDPGDSAFDESSYSSEEEEVAGGRGDVEIQNLAEQRQQAPSKSSKKSSSSPQENILNCIICCDREIEIVFVPCGHQLACRRCAQKFSQCPVCRCEIETMAMMIEVEEKRPPKLIFASGVEFAKHWPAPSLSSLRSHLWRN